MTMNRLMIDLEFMDTRPTAAILSIGAVFFDLESGKLGNEFYTVVSADDCVLRHNMTISADTVRWWVKQDINAIKQAMATDEAMMLELAMHKFNNFVSTVHRDNLMVYSQGYLDLAIIRNAWDKIFSSTPVPWHFYGERDSRTIGDLFPLISRPNVGTKHNALDDAKAQALHMIAIHKELHGGHSAKVKTSQKQPPVDFEFEDNAYLSARVNLEEAFVKLATQDEEL